MGSGFYLPCGSANVNYDLMALGDCMMECMGLDDDVNGCMGLDDDMELFESELSMQSDQFYKSAPKKGFGGGGLAMNGKFRSIRKNWKKKVKQIGSANAARVSRGSEVDTWKGLTKKTPVRNPAEHITVTVVLYFTVANGVPSEADVLAAIDDGKAVRLMHGKRA